MKRLFYLFASLMLVSLVSCTENPVDGTSSENDQARLEKIASLESQIKDMKATIASVQGVQNDLDAYIDALTASKEALQSKLDAVSQSLEALKAEVASAGKELTDALDALRTDLEAQIAGIDKLIEDLKAKDAALEARIKSVEEQVAALEEGAATTDWVNGTFATLAQQESLMKEVTELKASVEILKQGMAASQEELAALVESEVAKGMEGLTAAQTEKINALVAEYDAALESARADISAAYETYIEQSLAALEADLKAWCGGLLEEYCTIVAAEALIESYLAALPEPDPELQSALESSKADLADFKESYMKAIADAITESNGEINGRLDALQTSITALDAELKTLLSQLTVKVEALEGQIATIEEQIMNIENSLPGLVEASKALEAYVGRLQESAEDLQTRLDETNDAMEAMKTDFGNRLSASEQMVMNELTSVKTALEAQLGTINETITALQAKDVELKASIEALRTYVDEELRNTEDWAEATFATIEQYNTLVDELAAVKTLTQTTADALAALQTDVDAKVEAINTRLTSLEQSLATKVQEITSAYQTAIAEAKTQITEAYEAAIKTATEKCLADIQAWVTEQLDGYAKIAETDEKIAARIAALDARLAAQQTALENQITTTQGSLQAAIDQNKNDIAALQEAINNVNTGNTELSSQIVEINQKITKNVDDIAANSQEISKNTAAINANKAAIEENKTLIEQNKALAEANEKAVAELHSDLAALRTLAGENAYELATLTANVSKNADDIQVNTALLTQQGTAIQENAEAIAANAEAITRLNDDLADAKTELEQGYTAAIEAALANSGAVDSEALEELNTSIETKVTAINESISALTTRVNELETKIQEIQTALADLETRVEALEALLTMLQSVTFISEYTDEVAVAKYKFGTVTDAEGKLNRVPVGTFEFNYLVRPAEAVEALTNTTLWNNDIKMIGYYASNLVETKAGFDFIDFNITGITADKTDGVLTVTVENILSDDFYNGKTGAVASLSIATGKSDIASKFVPVVPKNESGLIYAESLTLSDTKLSIKKDETSQLTATVLPSNVSDAGVTYKSLDEKKLVVDQNGKLTALAEGQVAVEVVADITDEYGRQLKQTCVVTVLPNVQVKPRDDKSFIELDGTREFYLDAPSDFMYTTMEWSSSDPSLATIDQYGLATGVRVNYNSTDKEFEKVTVSCCIDGVTTYSIQVPVVYPQPTGVWVEGVGNASQVALKKGTTLDLSTAKVYPDAAQDYFYVVKGFPMNDQIATYNASTQILTAAGLGQTSIRLSVSCDENYYAGSPYFKDLYITVEPYYIKTMSFNLSEDDAKVALNGTKQLVPDFTSDVDGFQPTDYVLEWKSDNETVATVDQNGNVTGKSDGTVTITVTSSSTKDGSTVTASCDLKVVDPANVSAVGDYLLKNGKTSKTYVSGETIGVVFYLNSPRTTDKLLPEHCASGLAVAFGEGAASTWVDERKTADGYWKMYEWVEAMTDYTSTMGSYYPYSNASSEVRSELAGKLLGYNNTLAMNDFITAGGMNSAVLNALNSYRTTVPVDTQSTSVWYLPSVAEMDLIAAISSTINAKIGSYGTQLSDTEYWTVSDAQVSSANVSTVNPITGSYNCYGHKEYDSNPVRFIIAF